MSSSGDSGVSARLFGTFLTWLNDHQSDVFTICTCNDISKLPPEFSRAERFDGCFFLDLPSSEQRQKIWEIYLKLFDLDADQAKPNDQQWTGAEIRACCRLAALLDLPLTAAAQNVVPVAVTAAESVERLRSWASGRCLDAESSGIYQSSSRQSLAARCGGRTHRTTDEIPGQAGGTVMVSPVAFAPLRERSHLDSSVVGLTTLLFRRTSVCELMIRQKCL